jgi:hypothetical protein
MDLELTRTPGDRRLYTLEGVGTLRLQGFVSRTATAEADGMRWRIARRGRPGTAALRGVRRSRPCRGCEYGRGGRLDSVVSGGS